MTICTDGLAMGTEPMPRQLPHLPALDGLRAIAVIFVVAYHLDVGWARGGFIGVDIFFVISGFLITRLLIDEQGTNGRIAVIGFWIRRFRRLVPALVVMVGATLLATRWWGLPEQWDDVRRDGVASLAYVANWRFVFDRQSYFESAIGPSPLLHTWSLAVEEQWYLVWPIVMVGLLALAQRPRRGAAIATMTVVLAAVASAGLMAALYDPADASRVYFGTDTRAQQLLVGAALAWFTTWVPTLQDVPEHRVFRLASQISLVTLGVIAVTVDDTSAWLYRGGFLAISVLAAVVVFGTATTHRRGAFNWLGGQPWGWIGRRSYGIYLWHWPVILFVGPAMGLEMATVPLIAVQLTVTLLLAEMSFRLVEQPVRRSVAPATRTIAAWTLGASAGPLSAPWGSPPRPTADSSSSVPSCYRLTTSSLRRRPHMSNRSRNFSRHRRLLAPNAHPATWQLPPQKCRPFVVWCCSVIRLRIRSRSSSTDPSRRCGMCRPSSRPGVH